MRERRVPTPDGAFHVALAEGADAAPKVVLLHGLAASHRLWDEVAAPLAASGAAVATVDLLGHGLSDAPPHLYTIEDHARATVALLDGLGWSSAALVGNSMGALIALAAAAAHQGRVDQVVSIGCPAFGSAAARASWLRSRSSMVNLETGLGKVREAPHPGPAGQAVAADRALNGLWLLNSIWAIGSYDLMADLGRVVAPVHVAYGEHDWLRPLAVNLEALPGATTSTIPEAGHLAPLDEPQAVVACIAAALQ